MDFKFVTFLDDERPRKVEKLTVKFEADTSALHEALDDVLDHVDEVNAAIGGYLDDPSIGDIVSLASGSPDMTVISLCLYVWVGAQGVRSREEEREAKRIDQKESWGMLVIC